MKVAQIETDSKDPKDVPPAILQQFILDCFLNHKIKLIRNWGSADDDDHLCYKDVTLLHFATRSCNFQMLIRPKENRIHIAHHSKRGRKLYLYFVKKLSAMIADDYKPCLLRKTNMPKKRLLPTFEDLEAHIQDDDYSGWCTHCGDWTHDSCEPDAHEYECPVCENPTCYGAEELLITFMGI